MRKSRISDFIAYLQFVGITIVLIEAISGFGVSACFAKSKQSFRVLDPVGIVETTQTSVQPAKRLETLSGKRVWVIIVDQGSTIMPALVRLLPRYADRVKVRTIVSAEKGNPFFMLKPEDKPDAVIVGTGVCEASMLEAANYARQAEKIEVPAVASFNVDILPAYLEAIEKLRFPSIRAYATHLPDPARPADPERIAKRLIPQFIEGLTRPIGIGRPRICFRGTEERARAYFEALSWAGGLRVVLPTEDRVSAMLKGTSRRSSESVGVMAPGMRVVTVEKVAVHAVMAGCTSEQLPFALALAELFCQKKVGEEIGRGRPPALQILIRGEASRIAGLIGSKGEERIGRLARLMLIHLAGIPGLVFEERRIWSTVIEPEESAAECSISLFDLDRAEVWNQSTTWVDRWR